MKKVLLLAIALIVSISAYAADCRKAGTTCLDSAPSKFINGVSVPISAVGGCWQYQDTYDCLAPGALDYCAPLVSAGCAPTSSLCSTSAFNGDCEVYTKTYRCGNSIGRPTGTVVLSDTYTLTQDSLDRSACTSLDQNSSCTFAQTICIEGPETRNINGMSVYKDCWKYEDKFTCTAGNFVDYCTPLKNMACVETGNVCKSYAPWQGGPCLEYERTFNCNEKLLPVPTNVTYLDSSYSITEDTITSTCQDLESNPNCAPAGSVCVEGPATRKINGLDVYKDCWKTEKEYTCASNTLTDTCGELKARPECREMTAPVCVDKLSSGSCGLLEHTYECGIGEEKTQSVTNCSTQQFCIGGTCFNTSYSPDTDFGTAVAGMEAMREAAEYGLFKGTHDKCSRGYFGLKNCCSSQSGNASANNSSIASTIGVTALKVGAEAVKVYGSTYMYEGLFNMGSLVGSEMLQNYAMSSLVESASYVPSVSVYGVTFGWGVAAGAQTLIEEVGLEVAIEFLGAEACAPGLLIGFDPWSLALAVAVQVIMQMMACEEEDMLTAMKKGQGLCHKVGSYCGAKAFGSCVKKMEGYCCFPSKLGKIINEQGRPQIGKPWGDAESPDCSGFTLDQVARLDLSAMDFSEFIRSIPALNKGPGYGIQHVNDKANGGFTNPTGGATAR